MENKFRTMLEFSMITFSDGDLQLAITLDAWKKIWDKLKEVTLLNPIQEVWLGELSEEIGFFETWIEEDEKGNYIVKFDCSIRKFKLGSDIKNFFALFTL